MGGGITVRLVGTWGGLGVAVFFFLSGYGCWYSIQKRTTIQERSFWLLQHIIRLLIYFVIAFFFVGLIRRFVYGVENNWIEELLHLRIPGSTTWYLKIQILMYVFLYIALFVPKYETALIILFVVAYSLISKYIGLQDFWWKTALCFPAGTVVAANTEKLRGIIGKKKNTVILISIGFIILSVAWIVVDRWLILPLQLLSFTAFSVGLSFLFEILEYRNIVFEKVGKWSLSLYLVHIGIVGTIINKGTPIELLSFLAFTTAATILTEVISRGFYKVLLRKRKA